MKEICYLTKIFFKVCALYSVFCILFFVSACATAPTTEDIKRAEVYYKLGVSYLNKNQLKEAYIKFQEAIKLNPKDKYSLNALGYISARFKEYDDSISYYKKAISIDPDYSEAMNNLGVTYLELENWDGAVRYFRMALKNPLYSTPEKAYAGLGYALYKKGEYLEAEKILKEALTRDPESPQSIFALGLVYTGLGKIEDAIEMFNKTLDIQPNYIDAHWELANAHLRLGDNEKAIEHFQVVAKNSRDEKKREKALAYIELLKEEPEN